MTHTSQPVFANDLVTLYAADCFDMFAELGDDSVDAVVTDPPYNLSNSRNRDADCLRSIFMNIKLPYLNERNSKSLQRGQLPSPPLGCAELGFEHGAIGVTPGIAMPEGAIDFQNSTVIEHEVDACNKPAARPANRDLAGVLDSHGIQHSGHYVLNLADGADLPVCNATCSCFTEPSPGLITVLVSLPSAPRGDLASNLFGGPGASYPDIRTSDDSLAQSQGSAAVMAFTRAEDMAVLRLDLTSRSAELIPAYGAVECRPVFELIPAESVGACARAGDLAAEFEPTRVSLIDDPAHRTFSIYIPWHVIKRSRTASGFMGKRWDGWESPASFQRWVTAWAAECLRVLKPGGHMLAFGGTRTWHRLTAGIEDAGFEIRDSMAWLHSNGMPKSKTSMKPAFEPIVIARKPPIGSIVKNASIYGTGALNIDACRVGEGGQLRWEKPRDMGYHGGTDNGPCAATKSELGRWPSNALLDSEMADQLDEQAGGASRFFPVFQHQAKAPTKERPKVDGVAHPTVKPLALIEWLVKLVAPQNPDAVVLDPFAGSGTTVEACLNLGVRCIAGEREETYIPLIMERIGRSGRVSGSFPVK